MTDPGLLCPIKLSAPPRIIAMSAGSEHGRTSVERYRHDGFWCLNLFAGTGELLFDDKRLPFAPGFASITRPGRDNEYRFNGRTILTWVHFMPVDAGEPALIPLMSDLGTGFTAMRRALQEVAGLSGIGSPRVAARVWEVLWTLCERDSGEGTLHPTVRAAVDALCSDLARPLSVAALARRLEISQSQLNRLFRARFGTTVGGYLRSLRLDRACHLLTNTTQPIAAIARAVGVADAHHFNKLVRRHAGAPPRQIRARGLPT